MPFSADYVRLVLRENFEDAKRLFLAGHSVGGTLTLLTALASNRFRAAASFDGFPSSGH